MQHNEVAAEPEGGATSRPPGEATCTALRRGSWAQRLTRPTPPQDDDHQIGHGHAPVIVDVVARASRLPNKQRHGRGENRWSFGGARNAREDLADAQPIGRL